MSAPAPAPSVRAAPPRSGTSASAREVVLLTVPQLGLMLCHMGMSMTDVAVTGLISPAAQASLGAVGQVFTLLMLVASLAGSGCLAAVSQALGMGLARRAARYAALIVLLAFKKYAQDRALWRRVKRNLPQAGAAGRFIVLSAGSRRLPAGTELRVPFEGTLGGSMSCDVCVPYKKVHMRSAFFWVEGEELHLVPLHKDGFLADETPIEPGDEAVMRDGAILRVGELKLVLRMYDRGELADGADEPYVTSARRSKAGQGRGDGLGAPTRGAIRREKKKLNQSEADEKKRASAAQKREKKDRRR